MKVRRIVRTAIFLLGISPLLSAKIIRVKAGSSGASTGESWQDAIPELRDALATAISGDEIWVVSGDYKPTSDSDVNASFELKSGVAIYGGFSGAGIQGRNRTSAIYNSIIYENNTTSGIISETGSGPFDEERFFGNIIRGGYRQLDPSLVIDANPLFANPEGPDGIPGTLDDDFRLLVSSPAIDTGGRSHLPSGLTTDYLNQPRVTGSQIDIGATEGPLFATFQLLNPSLDPEDDFNHNGSSNFADYAAGGDPRERHNPALLPRVSGGNLIFSVRNNASDVSSQFQKSIDLESWNTLLEDTDYTTQNPVVSQGGRDTLTLRLAQPLPPRIFFRQLLQSNP